MRTRTPSLNTPISQPRFSFHTSCMNNAGILCTPASILLHSLAKSVKIRFCQILRKKQLSCLRLSHLKSSSIALCSFPLREENAVAFAPDRSENGRRGICWVGFECEILRVCRPSHGRSVHDELSVELLLGIVKMSSLLYSAPEDVKGNIRGY